MESMGRVIISGADGFIGSYTVSEFLRNGYEVLALGRRSTPSRLRPNKNMIYLPVDVADTESWQTQCISKKYDVFIHLAWDGSAGILRSNEEIQVKNALDCLKIMRAASEVGCNRFVCAGTIMEYETETVVHLQQARPESNYIYGAGKSLAHSLCKIKGSDWGIEVVWPMITNAYGIGERSPRMLNSTIRKILDREPLEFTAALQNYDFIYVTDVAKALFLITERGYPFCEYMIGSTKARPLKEFIMELIEEVAPDLTPSFGVVPYSGVNLPIEVFSTSKLKHDCGFTPLVSFREGVRMTFNWIKETEYGGGKP